MVSHPEAPCNILGIVHSLFGLVFIMFLPLLADFVGIHLVSPQDGKPGEQDGAAPLHRGMAPRVFWSSHAEGCSEEGGFPARKLDKENWTAQKHTCLCLAQRNTCV